ncbi:hypothetical protein [Actinocorallia longicatena]|uniref:Secreted protein n=1 Tax=Actinocorallia longicatena TaxID=111803 RepID=A0ABP6PXE1_9ACTN
MKTNVKVLVPVLAAGLAAGAVAVPAAASPAGRTVTYTSEMRLYSPNGRPLNTVYGNCGKSWLTIRDVGVRKYQVKTGFQLSGGRKAISYAWTARITGPGHKRNQFWGGGLRARAKWEGQHTHTVRAGRFRASVVAGSHAVLTNRQICASGLPFSIASIR